MRRLGEGKVLAGFAGATADAFTLFELFEKKLKEHGRSLPRAAVELAKQWRTDRFLRRLEALLMVADERSLLRPLRLGRRHRARRRTGRRGGGHRLGRPRTRSRRRGRCWPTRRCRPRTVAEESMKLAAEICIYTNDRLTIEEL